MASSNYSLLRQLNAINRNLCAVIQVMGELLLTTPDRPDESLSPSDLREAGHSLIASGGDLTELGVKMGVRADELERAEQV